MVQADLSLQGAATLTPEQSLMVTIGHGDLGPRHLRPYLRSRAQRHVRAARESRLGKLARSKGLTSFIMEKCR